MFQLCLPVPSSSPSTSVGVYWNSVLSIYPSPFISSRETPVTASLQINPKCIPLVLMLSGGPSMPWLAAGLGFPARAWAGSWRWKPQPPATRPEVSDENPGPSALRIGISTKTESSEPRKVFSERKKVHYVWIDNRWTQKESPCVAPALQFELLYGVFLPSFLWLIILIYLVHSP